MVGDGGSFRGKAWFEGVHLDEIPSSGEEWPASDAIQTFGPAYRYPAAGWIYLHIEGKPYERGYQHGHLMSRKFRNISNDARTFWVRKTIGMITVPRRMHFFCAASTVNSGGDARYSRRSLRCGRAVERPEHRSAGYRGRQYHRGDGRARISGFRDSYRPGGNET